MDVDLNSLLVWLNSEIEESARLIREGSHREVWIATGMHAAYNATRLKVERAIRDARRSAPGADGFPV